MHVRSWAKGDLNPHVGTVFAQVSTPAGQCIGVTRGRPRSADMQSGVDRVHIGYVLAKATKGIMQTPRQDCPKLQCDCSHPGECLFGPPEAERPSYVIVWIVGALVIAVVVLVLCVL